MNHVGNRYYPNHWHKFCYRWWLHWLDFGALCRDVRDFFERGRNGFARCDIFDLMTYHCGITLGLLRHFRNNYSGFAGESDAEYTAKIDSAIDGWEAKWILLTENYWGDESTRKALQDRFERGNNDFIEIYDSLWN